MARPIKATPVLTEEQYDELCEELEYCDDHPVYTPRITLSRDEIEEIISGANRLDGDT